MQRRRPAPASGWQRRARAAVRARGWRTVLAERRHDGPLVVQKPLYPEGDAVCHAIVVHPPGGIAGGDELVDRWRAASAKRARAAHHARRGQVVPLAGAAGRASGYRFDVERRMLEWLPQETIVFDGALAAARLRGRPRRARRAIIGWDIVCLGRTGSGERFTAANAELRSTHHARGQSRSGSSAAALPAAATLLRSPAALRGCTGLRHARRGAGVRRDHRGACRRAASTDVAAVTQLPGVLVARYLGDSTRGGASSASARSGQLLRRPCSAGRR